MTAAKERGSPERNTVKGHGSLEHDFSLEWTAAKEQGSLLREQTAATEHGILERTAALRNMDHWSEQLQNNMGH